MAIQQMYTGAHVVMQHCGTKLLGEVFAFDGEFLSVRHFDRSHWPISPRPEDVEFLERTYDECED